MPAPDGRIVGLAEEVARGPSAGGGEIALRVRRGAAIGVGVDVHELIVDGVFAMDSVDSSSEVLLAREALNALEGNGFHVVVGGLGLGFTLREVLSDDRVAAVTVVELEPSLVEWCRSGLVPSAYGLLDDPRVAVVVADLADYLREAAVHAVDALLLDVDNGPTFLVHAHNAAIYDDALGRALALLRAGGVLAIWCERASADLAARLGDLADDVRAVTVPIERDGRSFDYLVYLATPPLT